MPDPTFSDLPILGELGAALDAAMAREADAATATHATATHATAALAADSAAPGPATTRRRLRLPSPFRTLAIAVLLAGLGTSTAAATLTVLRGSPIPAPRAIDVQPAMTPQFGTAEVLPLRATEPGGGPPFALRRAKGETGLLCVSVGQFQAGQFGITGTDGTFRELPATVIDGCGQPAPNLPAVMGARVFDAPDRGDVRTVVYGVGATGLETATVEARGRTQPMEVRDGAFVLGLREYPEDLDLKVTLTFEGGKRVRYPLGASLSAFVDPTGPAWRVQAAGQAGWNGVCILVGAARPSTTSPTAPPVCGASTRRSGWARDHVVSIRTMRPGDHGVTPGQGEWNWRQAPARTLVTGYADPKKIKTVTVLGAGDPITAKRTGGGTFLVPLLPQDSEPRVRLTFADGTQRIVTGDANTITPRKEASR